MKNVDFVAIDFETATSERMACQIGVVVVKNGVIVERYSRLIQPPNNEYDWHTIKVHHITPDDTRCCDTFDVVWRDISKYFCSGTIVAHNASFDSDVLSKNLKRYYIPSEGIGEFVCTYKIYGLSLECLCSDFGIKDESHHDALFDAECCAKFYLNYINGIKPANYSDDAPVVEEGYFHKAISGDVLKKDLTGANPNNPLYNKKVVITGLFTQERNNLANMIKKLGADIDTSITKRTSFVLIGKDPGPKKIETIEKLLLDGYEIKKLYQSDINEILNEY